LSRGKEQNIMNRIPTTSFFLLLAAALGLWGCSRSAPPDAARETSATRALEAKATKLEEELQTAQSARDHLRLKLESMEKDRATMARQLQTMTTEKNELRGQLLTRTTERDTLQSQYENFRKELRSLLGQADAAAPAPTNAQPVTVLTPATPGKS
jgi:septal ring factor EnvC (AmiA/AmiB activator)